MSVYKLKNVGVTNQKFDYLAFWLHFCSILVYNSLCTGLRAALNDRTHLALLWIAPGYLLPKP